MLGNELRARSSVAGLSTSVTARVGLWYSTNRNFRFDDRSPALLLTSYFYSFVTLLHEMAGFRGHFKTMERGCSQAQDRQTFTEETNPGRKFARYTPRPEDKFSPTRVQLCCGVMLIVPVESVPCQPTVLRSDSPGVCRGFQWAGDWILMRHQ